MEKASLETEFKAGVDAETMDRISRDAAMLAGEASEEVLRSLYFDAPDMRLERAGISLRVRLAGAQWVQTIKLNRTGQAGLHRVTEVETRISEVDAGSLITPAPDFFRISDPYLRAHVRSVLGGAPLVEVCETRVRRRTHLVDTPRGKVELALDTGDILARGIGQRISEVEVELLEGDTEAVFNCAGKVLGDKAARLVLPSKAARGFELAKSGLPLPERSILQTSTQVIDGALYDARSAEEAFSVLLGAYAQAVSENLYATLTSTDPEGPHQLRVVLRRLRALHGAFRLHVRRKPTRYLSRMARHHGRIVSRLRDADVIVNDVLRPAIGNDEGGRRLLGALETWRDEMRAQVRAELLKAHATGFAIELMGLADTGDWRPRGVHRKRRLAGPVTSVVFHELDDLWSVVRGHGKSVSAMSASGRHAFRKDLKNLRYAAEIAVCNREGAAFEGFFNQLQSLQSDLGYLNDIATLEAFSPELQEASSMQALEVLKASLLGDIAAKKDRKLARLDKRWKAFRRETHFWM